MRMKIVATALALVGSVSGLASTTTYAAAPQSADLTVKGTIDPDACTPTLSASTLNYGVKSYSELSDTEWTTAPDRQTNLTITCPTATATYWSWTDNHPPAEQPEIPYSAHVFGTSRAPNGQDVATYTILIGEAQADGAAATKICTDFTNQPPWSEDYIGGCGFVASSNIKPYLYAIGHSGGDPEPHVTVMYPLTVRLQYNARAALALTEDAQFDGGATFTIFYP